MTRENTAAFIGHNECCGVTKEQVKEAVISLIEQGVSDFLSGGQVGFDRLCGHCVYEEKRNILKSTTILSYHISLSM